jgi:hypothetical protein
LPNIRQKIDKNIPINPATIKGTNLITSPVIAVPILISKVTINNIGNPSIIVAAGAGIKAAIPITIHTYIITLSMYVVTPFFSFFILIVIAVKPITGIRNHNKFQ